jgi:hypothetical protein
MNDRAWPVLGQQPVDQIGITNIALDKNMPPIVQKPGKILQIPGIGQLVQIDDRMIESTQVIKNEIRADESSSSCDQKNISDQHFTPS